MTKTQQLFELLKNNGFTTYDLAVAYWSDYIDTYVECCCDFEDEQRILTEEETNKIVRYIMDDDYLWETADSDVYDFINEVLREREEQ